ncbi:titin-like [Anabas testudineus]|uniref:titin-like n=1 Tax=Anabas testudineus TaxID=64144 RepID=UPI000E45C065|nr:titin-like [Anabas testudineus]
MYAVVQGQNDWGVTYTSTQICDVEGSTVDIHCSYTYPSRISGTITTVIETLWFTRVSYYEDVDLRTASVFAGRLQYFYNKNSCTLRITDLRQSDSGVYYFRFITNQPGGRYTGEPGVTLTVTVLQVKSYRSRSELQCYSSCRPDHPSYIWYKNGEKISGSQEEISYHSRYYDTDSYSCALRGHEDFPSPSVCVNDQTCNRVIYSDRSICAFKGSSVDISCTYNSNRFITSRFWFRPERGPQWKNPSQSEDLLTDSQYTGRVQVLETERGRSTLRITDLRETDSAQYQFTFRTSDFEWGSSLPGTTLTVTDPDLQVLVWRFSSTKVWLKCYSSCRLPDHSSYIWYKNGEKINENQEEISQHSLYYIGDSYSCALRGHEDFPSPSVCVRDENCNRVIYTDRSICVSKGSSVNISCTYNSYYEVTSKFWFRPERGPQWKNPSQSEDLLTDSQYTGRVQVLETERGRSTLRITDLRETDSAQYQFTFRTWSFEWGSSLPGTTLTVTDPDLQVLRSYSTNARLMCYSSCRLPDHSSYIWYKNGEKINENQEEISFYSSYYVTDSYSCALRGHEDFPSPSVCVDGENCNRVIYTDRSICVSKGSSVDISCTYNSYYKVTSKFWFRPERGPQWKNPSQSEDLLTDSQYTGRVQVLETERGRSTLRITDLRETDSAQYQFTFRTSDFEWGSSLPGTTLTVTALQVHVITLTVHQSYTEAELQCHSSCSSVARLSYVWFKNGQKVMKEDALYKDSFYPGDVICCALKGHENHCSPSVYALKVPSVSVSPQSEIMEGSSVTLTCNSDAQSAVNYTWYKKNQTLLNKEPQLVFSSIQSSDSGEFYCSAENELGKKTSPYININVKHGPKNSNISVSPSEIVEGSSVTLTCSSDANPAANYTWYKGNQTIHHGPEGIYHFTSISSADTGTYFCKSENQYGDKISSTSINVQYRPNLPSVSLSPSEIVEGSSVTLTCSSDANPAANYTWYKENEESPKASGPIFTITDIRHEHSGNYYCEAWNTRGRHNSTLSVIRLSGAWKSKAAGISTAVVLVFILLSVFILMRTKRLFKQSPEAAERHDSRERVQTRSQQEEQDDLHYASVQFCKNQEDPVYSNFRPAQLETHEEDLEYATVKFSGCSAALRIQYSEEDVAALYSTVVKTC